MERKASILNCLIEKLDEICGDPDLVKGILCCLETDVERNTILKLIEYYGEDITPLKITYAAINIDNERRGIK